MKRGRGRPKTGAPIKERRIVFVTEESRATALEHLSKETGAPVSELVRRAVDKYLEANRK